MPTNTKTAPAPTKRAAKAPAPVATQGSSAQPTQRAKGTAAAKASVAQAPLYLPGKMPPVRAGTIRHYAQQVAVALAAKHPKGYTLAQYRAALVAGAAASSVQPPRGGWQGHNMPTWAAHPNQQWLVPTGAQG